VKQYPGAFLFADSDEGDHDHPGIVDHYPPESPLFLFEPVNPSNDKDDYNGNSTSKTDSTGTTSYTWDFVNRLTSVTLPNNSGTVTFKYDPFGRRIYRSSSSGTSIYTYDGSDLVEETNASGAVVARYSQGLNVDEPLAMLRAGATSFYNADGLATITSLANGAGALAQTYTFDSFGNRLGSSGSLTNPFQYTGREFDAETSLYFYRARYYDAATGRFLSEDPLRFRSGVNFYSYVRNSVINNNDPFGLINKEGLTCGERRDRCLDRRDDSFCNCKNSADKWYQNCNLVCSPSDYMDGKRPPLTCRIQCGLTYDLMMRRCNLGFAGDTVTCFLGWQLCKMGLL
jgi:RHS repeat-associated protein